LAEDLVTSPPVSPSSLDLSKERGMKG